MIGSLGRQSHSSLLQLKIAKWVCHIGWHLADAREYLLTSVASAVSITSAVLCYDMLFRVSHSHLLLYNECKKTVEESQGIGENMMHRTVLS